MGFITPMFASPMPTKKPIDFRPGEWALEEKIDGHRLVAQVSTAGGVTAWSRYGLERALQPNMVVALKTLPEGIYDGELLVPGHRSYGVTELINGPNLVYTVFDILELMGNDMLEFEYDSRRLFLERLFYNTDRERITSPAGVEVVNLTPSRNLSSIEEAYHITEQIWDRGGEGAILKRRKSLYSPGKRPKDWIKLKDLKSAVLTVIGFQAGKGLINDRGLYATVVLKDDEGNVTTVKTRNDEELAKFSREAPTGNEFTLGGPQHPAIGRKLRIEFQERTPDGNYRHPRWDRWEAE